MVLFLDAGVEDAKFLGVLGKFRPVLFLDLKKLQFTGILQQPSHVGLAHDLFVVLGKRQQERGEVLTAGGQQFNGLLRQLDFSTDDLIRGLPAYFHPSPPPLIHWMKSSVLQSCTWVRLRWARPRTAAARSSAGNSMMQRMLLDMAA